MSQEDRDRADRPRVEAEVRAAREGGKDAELVDALDTLAGIYVRLGYFRQTIEARLERIQAQERLNLRRGKPRGYDLERDYEILVRTYRDDLHDLNRARYYKQKLHELNPSRYSTDPNTSYS